MYRKLTAVALVATSLATASADVLELQSTNPELEGHFGACADGIPDCDGDGVDDVIVGADDEDGGGVTNAGRVYIFSGATGVLIRAHSSPNDATNGGYGRSVSGIPDINGDGRGDYIVGAYGEPGPGGRAYVYSGASGTLLRTHSSPNAETAGYYGFSVAGIDDLSGDGRGDYIIGAAQENNGGTTDAGRVYIYSGNTGNLIRSHNSPNAESFGKFGYAVSGIPDVNNDNRGDYIVGAPYEDPGAALSDSGKAYVFNGSSGALLHSLSSGEPDSGGRFGWSVAGLEDVGGNGFGDVLVGAPYETLEQSGDDLFQAGFAYLFSGTSGALAQTFSEPVEHQSSDGIFGYSVGGIDDTDGDGLGEMIIGAPSWPGYYAYTYNGGSPYTFKDEYNTPDDLGADQFWGGWVAGVGDVTGDGRGDFVICGQGSDDFPNEDSETGRAYVYRNVYNDGCSLFGGVVTLQTGDNPVTTIGASEGGAEDDCTQFADPGPDVWFRYIAPCSGSVNFSTCGQADWNTKIAVYAGCSYTVPLLSCNLTELLACNDNSFFCTGGTSTVTVDNVIEGDCFFVRLGGGNNESGTGTLTVSPTCAGCVADLNNDAIVDGADLSILLGGWGNRGITDLNDDGITDGADLSIVLGGWGPC